MGKSSIDFRVTSRLLAAMRCLAAGICITLCATLRADVPSGPELLEAEHALSMEFETPHTKWAKPYAQGPTRVLFFAPWYQGSTEGREIIELMQRFDLEADAAYFAPGPKRLVGDGNPRWYGDPELATKRVLRLMEKPYDVFFLNQVPLSGLPDAVQTAIKSAVQAGAGLIYVGKDENWGQEVFTASESMPEAIKVTKAFTAGEGRILHLPLRDKLSYTLDWEVQLDYQMADQGRALLWAAKKEPKARVFIKADPDPRKTTITWSGVEQGAKVYATVRSATNNRFTMFEKEVGESGEAFLDQMLAPAGEYHIDGFIRTENGVEDWASISVRASQEKLLGELALVKDWFEIGETLEATIPIPTVETYKLHFDVVDKDGRVLQRHDAIPKDGVASFSSQIPDWFPMLVRVEAVLTEGSSKLDTASSYVRIVQRKRDQFHFMMWNTPTADLAPYGVESLARHGVTSILQGGDPPLSFSASELAYVPYAASFRASSHTVTAMLDEQGILKGGCVHDEEAMNKLVRETVERHRKSREHGIFVYSLGDENAVRASCLGPHCIKAYREYLKEVYGDIDALNASWGEKYTTFDDVNLFTEGPLPAPDAPEWFRDFYKQRFQKDITDDEIKFGEAQVGLGDINDEIRALQDENYARWYDRQAFQNWSYVKWCKRFLVAFKELDPQALTGFEGTDSFSLRRHTTRSRQGGDLDLFMREMEYFGPYHGPANEVVRSLAKPNFPTGNWIGYSMDPDEELGYYWGQITNNMNTIQWWRWDNIGEGYHGYLLPSLAPSPTARPLIEDTQVVRDGLGDLLMKYPMEKDGIAMLYSMPSTHIAHFDGNETYGLYNRDHDRWHEAIHNAGLQFDYVTDRQLRLGEFDASKYRVLILPLAFAIGEREASVIRDFVQQGGTLIADVRPGLYNDRCKPYESGGILDDVFGVKRGPKQKAADLDRMRIDGTLNGRKVYMEWGNWYGRDVYPQMYADPSVELTTGEALGWTFPIHFHHGLKYPAAIQNNFGQGKALLFNFAIYPAPFDEFLRQALAASGVEAAIQVREVATTAETQEVARLLDEGEQVPAGSGGPAVLDGEEGAHPEGVELTRWKNGDVELIALLGPESKELHVTLPEPRHVIDIKSKKSFGSVSEFPVALVKARASFFALLPDAPQPPEIDLGSADAAPGEVLTPTIAVPGPSGPRALKLHLNGPNDNQANWLADHVVIESGQGKVTIPFALNDPRGQWTLHAEDILTGASIAATITVK
ncbi:MAG: beta-galactosidase trimerization domain-containing protein [Candidatus Hydrogenedentes bacterium]|nr:beta-galactosidase trimerization domain-containing protein [Candidatus Hydrogenedentota bacterium]